eukprot:TRINITY_DN71413_c0_g1_i1.p1 TRINITY_DN71413_c0_g1~~TRINITY_DN71413_c0_g1_i1.p1  ORF type:complete len:624 (-),score=44.80 TRINITY_DN71413_c0_g1_i1:10-1788(-)
MPVCINAGARQMMKSCSGDSSATRQFVCVLDALAGGQLDAFAIRALSSTLLPRLRCLWGEVSAAVDTGRQLDVSALLRSLAESRSFRELWAGQDRGPFLLPAVDSIRGILTFDDIVKGLAATASAGRGVPCEAALTLTDGGAFRCPLSLPPIQTASEFQAVLEYGTVFMNMAALHWTACAAICLEASIALQFPTNINVYVTGPGRSVSTDVHTDNHDVLVLHTQGSKRWRVYAPPQRRKGTAHPLYRGKHEDRLKDSELGEPLVDVVLRAGEMLFIPMGFPHSTGTEHADDNYSVHLTLGISTADYGFCIGDLARALLKRLGQDGCIDDESLSDTAFWPFMSPMPVGCLVSQEINQGDDPEIAQNNHVAARLEDILQLVAPQRLANAQRIRSGGGFPSIRMVSCQIVSEFLAQLLSIRTSQDEAYEEVLGAPDGIFLAVGPEASVSEYRQRVLLHQAQEAIRKRRLDDPGDPRFARRIDPCDGVARTRSEIRTNWQERGLPGADSDAAVEEYWDKQCVQVYPNDQPPEELVRELREASESVPGLLIFLQRRVPSLRSSAASAHRGKSSQCDTVAVTQNAYVVHDGTEWERVD